MICSHVSFIGLLQLLFFFFFNIIILFSPSIFQTGPKMHCISTSTILEFLSYTFNVFSAFFKISLLLIFSINSFLILTDDHFLTIFLEFVSWNFQVQWSWTLSNSTGDIVVRTVTWAEPTTKITRFTNWNTTQVSADTQHD